MRLAFLSALKHLCTPLVGLMVLSACSVAVDEGRPKHPPVRPNQPQMCTIEYAPVCGVRNNRQRSFGNSCQARAEGYRIVNNGQCRPSQSRPPHWQQPNQPGRPGGNWSGTSSRPQTACTRQHAPVCASNRGRMQTFSNSCVARNAGFHVMRNGTCR